MVTHQDGTTLALPCIFAIKTTGNLNSKKIRNKVDFVHKNLPNRCCMVIIKSKSVFLEKALHVIFFLILKMKLSQYFIMTGAAAHI